jgi:hypothetical protein
MALLYFTPQQEIFININLLSQSYRMVKDYISRQGGHVYDTCKTMRYAQYRDLIKTALALGE